jgi:hypothetical protein
MYVTGKGFSEEKDAKTKYERTWFLILAKSTIGET